MTNKYYQKHKERLWKEACYQNAPKEQRQKLFEHIKNCYIAYKK